MRSRSSLIATSPSKAPRDFPPCRRGGGSRGRDGGDGDEGCPARSRTGPAGGRRGRLRFAASSGPTVHARFGAYLNGPGSGSRSRVLISSPNATHTLTQRLRTQRSTLRDPRRLPPRFLPRQSGTESHDPMLQRRRATYATQLHERSRRGRHRHKAMRTPPCLKGAAVRTHVLVL
jgi:hypothetical protein